ncbi:MAG: DUF882 domain-containing protein [Alphaproteobacteria bacterium]|nr:DUF882 domain-containing protein [Alphaproteobacteria bacterium]
MLGRRRLLLLGGGRLAGGLSAPSSVLAARSRMKERSIAIEHVETGEKFSRAYWANGKYSTRALREIYHLLRDHRTGEVRVIDIRLIELLHDLHLLTRSRKPFEIVSGYRSSRTNAMLAHISTKVANHSFHIRGMAADIRLADRDLSALRTAALAMQRGGVGYYPSSDFIHVDVGPQRHW